MIRPSGERLSPCPGTAAVLRGGYEGIEVNATTRSYRKQGSSGGFVKVQNCAAAASICETCMRESGCCMACYSTFEDMAAMEVDDEEGAPGLFEAPVADTLQDALERLYPKGTVRFEPLEGPDDATKARKPPTKHGRRARRRRK